MSRVLRRSRLPRAPLSNAMRVYLLTGSYARAVAARAPGSTGFGGGVAEVLLAFPDHRAAWETHRDELLAEFAVTNPREYPWAWHEYESRAPRPTITDPDGDLENDDENAALDDEAAWPS
jgi:hypothetical protein